MDMENQGSDIASSSAMGSKLLSDIIEIRRQFLAKLPAKLNQMKLTGSKKLEENAKETSMLCHQFKGTSASLGFRELASDFAVLEQECHKGNEEKFAQKLSELKKVIPNLDPSAVPRNMF